MNLASFITYLGLLITAYSATQEYNRLKLKLSSRWWKFFYLLSLFLMFISTLDWLKIELTQKAYIQILFNDFFWKSKYQIILLLNLFSLYKMFTSTKLSKGNSREFYDLLYELQIEKKDYLFNKLIKENLESIFKYQEHLSIIEKARSKLYFLIDPFTEWDKRIKEALNKQSIEQHEYYKKHKKLKKYEQINTSYTKFEKIRKYISSYIKIRNTNNYFHDIFNIAILNKNRIEKYVKNDEKLGLNILTRIAKYNYFTDYYDYVNIFLLSVLSDKNSITFNSLYNKYKNIKFILDNQNYENGFDLGIIICNTIDKLISHNQDILTKSIIDNSDNKTYQHIKKLFYILERLDGNKTHLMAEPLYIQRTLLNHIIASERDENIAYNLLLTQCSTIEYLALKTKEDYNIKLLENLLSELFNIDNLNKSKFLDIGLIYLDYIFIRNFKDAKKTIEQRIDDFKEYIINNTSLEIIELFVDIFNKSRSYNGKDYTSYVKQDEILKNHWNDVNEFLTSIKLKHEA